MFSNVCVSESTRAQLLLKSETLYYSEGTLIADSQDPATGLMVITSGHVSLTRALPQKSAFAYSHSVTYALSAITHYDHGLSDSMKTK